MEVYIEGFITLSVCTEGELSIGFAVRTCILKDSYEECLCLVHVQLITYIRDWYFNSFVAMKTCV